MAAGGIVLIRVHVNYPGAIFWLGMALAASGLWFLAAAFANFRGAEALAIELATGLRFKKNYFMLMFSSLELEGEREGNKVALRRTNGASKRGYTSELVFTITGRAEAGFSLAIFPEGFFRRPFGLFPPALPARPGWAEQNRLVVRGRPEAAAGAAAERLWRAVSGALPVGELRLLKISGGEMRAEFVKRGSPYEPGEIKHLLDLCLKGCQSRI